MNKNNTNRLRAAQLGMPAGTANHRLRKMILFKYVRIAGHDNCFKCGKIIETVEELSIEHKEPWFERDVDKFWDLDNIAFSHLKCNVPHRTNSEKLRRADPEGQSWCYKCKDFLPVNNFYSDAAKSRGLSDLCKVHHLERTNTYKRIVRGND